jgi:hypothetical protein
MTKIGVNEMCSCGSKIKYKKCCLLKIRNQKKCTACGTKSESVVTINNNNKPKDYCNTCINKLLNTHNNNTNSTV